MRLLPADPVRRGRAKLALLGFVLLAPLFAATLAYTYRWSPGNAGNYGELIEPTLLVGPPFDGLRGRWLLVSVDASACDAYCERKLYLLRQVRRAQGRQQGRVERVWIVTDPASAGAEVTIQPQLLAAIEGTRIERSRARPPLPAQQSARDYIYLVDPHGNLMMRWPRDPDPSRMLKDLSRLLRYSAIG